MSCQLDEFKLRWHKTASAWGLASKCTRTEDPECKCAEEMFYETNRGGGGFRGELQPGSGMLLGFQHYVEVDILAATTD